MMFPEEEFADTEIWIRTLLVGDRFGGGHTDELGPERVRVGNGFRRSTKQVQT